MKWTDHIEKGDIIEGPTGLLRVVRQVNRWVTKTGRTYTTVTLAIRTPSWTARPYTVVNEHDLRWRGYRPTGKKFPLESDFDRRLESHFGRTERGPLSAWDVLGMA